MSPLLVGAAILQATTTLRFGSAVLAAPLHHPLHLAEQARMLATISKGRFVLGLGIGHLEPDFEAFGVDHGRRSDILDDMLEAMGDVPAPLWIGAHSARGIDRAGRWADAWIADPQRTVEQIAPLADQVPARRGGTRPAAPRRIVPRSVDRRRRRLGAAPPRGAPPLLQRGRIPGASSTTSPR